MFPFRRDPISEADPRGKYEFGATTKGRIYTNCPLPVCVNHSEMFMDESTRSAFIDRYNIKINAVRDKLVVQAISEKPQAICISDPGTLLVF